MTIALNMIVGPYEEPFLHAAITSTLDLVDELVFVDTAPENNPNREELESFREYNMKIIDMPRGEDKDFNFAMARELARTYTTMDWVLRLDADEVLHEKDIENLKRFTNDDRFNTIEISFYHFMVYPWLYQYIEPKGILMRTGSFSWIKDVHEVPRTTGRIRKEHEIKYFHYGYCRGQEEVFKRWQLYVEIDGRPTWYQGVNPATILDDRISVCQNFKGEHPIVVQDTLAKLFHDVTPFQVKEIPRYRVSDKFVGLLLITYNDKENLERMLLSLEATIDYPTVLYIADMGSTDGTYDLLIDWQQKMFAINPYFKDIIIQAWPNLESLTKTMNVGFKSLMSRQECDFIGWIHPDMLFESCWLSELVATLDYHPEIGKACSFNTRDGWPVSEEIKEGQEQAYLIRRGILFRIGLFDEKFIGIGGYEDWDMNNRIRQEGLKVVIVPRSKVWHKGMQTRSRRDTSAEQIYNAGVYQTKWKSHKESIE